MAKRMPTNPTFPPTHAQMRHFVALHNKTWGGNEDENVAIQNRETTLGLGPMEELQRCEYDQKKTNYYPFSRWHEKLHEETA